MMKRKILSIQALRKRNVEISKNDYNEDDNTEENGSNSGNNEDGDIDTSPITILSDLGFSQFLQSHIGGNRTKLEARKTCMGRVVNFAEYAYYKV